MHAKAVEKVQRQVAGALKQCQVVAGHPSFESVADHIKALSAEVLKQKREWLTNVDVFWIFFNRVYRALRKYEFEEESGGGLWDLLGNDRASILVDDIVEYFKSIPRTYDVYLLAPKPHDQYERLELSRTFAFEVVPDRQQSLKDFIPIGLEPGAAYLRYTINGFCGSNLDGGAPATAFSRMKVLLQQGLHVGVFKEPDYASRYGLLESWSTKKLSLICVDHAEPERFLDVDLPLGVSKFIHGLRLNSSAFKNSDDFRSNLSAILKVPCMLADTTQVDALRIKSAIEWCFGSYVSEDTTIAFLQACFGLESIFGDEKETDAVTRTLADRCAYLISDSINERASIREKFRELYGVRSKIVHGSLTNLGVGNVNLLHWARWTLEKAITKEIRNLRGAL